MKADHYIGLIMLSLYVALFGLCLLAGFLGEPLLLVAAGIFAAVIMIAAGNALDSRRQLLSRKDRA